MHKTILGVLGAVLLSAQLANAQARVPEWFIGYSNLQSEGLPNRNTPGWIFDTEFFQDRATLHGANVEFSGFDISGLGMTADASYHRQRESFEEASGASSSNHTDVWYLLAGPSIKWNRTPGQSRLEPFIRVMAGAAHTRFRGATTTAGGVQTTLRAGTWDFAMAGGGGLDIRFGGVKVRVVQVDYAPIFLSSSSFETLSGAGVIEPTMVNSQRQDNIRFSFGIAF
jgi:opacity protein-like surface antigen